MAHIYSQKKLQRHTLYFSFMGSHVTRMDKLGNPRKNADSLFTILSSSSSSTSLNHFAWCCSWNSDSERTYGFRLSYFIIGIILQYCCHHLVLILCTSITMEVDKTSVFLPSEGLRQYYITKIEDLMLTVSEKNQNLRRLQAQRNELNAKVRMLREELQLLQEQGR